MCGTGRSFASAARSRAVDQRGDPDSRAPARTAAPVRATSTRRTLTTRSSHRRLVRLSPPRRHPVVRVGTEAGPTPVRPDSRMAREIPCRRRWSRTRKSPTEKARSCASSRPPPSSWPSSARPRRPPPPTRRSPMESGAPTATAPCCPSGTEPFRSTRPPPSAASRATGWRPLPSVGPLPAILCRPGPPPVPTGLITAANLRGGPTEARECARAHPTDHVGDRGAGRGFRSAPVHAASCGCGHAPPAAPHALPVRTGRWKG